MPAGPTLTGRHQIAMLHVKDGADVYSISTLMLLRDCESAGLVRITDSFNAGDGFPGRHGAVLTDAGRKYLDEGSPQKHL